MENLIVYPENNSQLIIVKSFLEEMKIRFKSDQKEKVKIKISAAAKESIQKGLIDADQENFFTEDEVDKYLDDVCN